MCSLCFHTYDRLTNGICKACAKRISAQVNTSVIAELSEFMRGAKKITVFKGGGLTEIHTHKGVKVGYCTEEEIEAAERDSRRGKNGRPIVRA